MASYNITSQTDLTGTTFDQVDTFNLIGPYIPRRAPAAPSFSSAQFDGIQILDNVTFVNTNGRTHSVAVTGSDIDASQWQFQNWLKTNAIKLTGTTAADTIVGSIQADTIEGGAGSDQLDGGDGVDTLSYAHAVDGITVDLFIQAGTRGDAMGDVIANIENVTGGSGDDILTGDGGANMLLGGMGNDLIKPSGGGDYLDGGAGVDTLSYAESTTGVRVSLWRSRASGGDSVAGFEIVIGGLANDKLWGGNGSSILYGGLGDDRLFGRNGNSILYGESGDDMLAGGFYDDILFGGDDDDTITGGFGVDSLNGQDGNDRLTGGAGVDIQTGGGGEDTFAFEADSDSGIGLARDRITDFEQGLDKIDLSKIDAIVGGTDDAFTFYGKVPPQGVDGELRFHFTPTQTIVSGDTDGDGTSNFQIALDGNIVLLATDFIL